jgi:hypothetical protein
MPRILIALALFDAFCCCVAGYMLQSPVPISALAEKDWSRSNGKRRNTLGAVASSEQCLCHGQGIPSVVPLLLLAGTLPPTAKSAYPTRQVPQWSFPALLPSSIPLSDFVIPADSRAIHDLLWRCVANSHAGHEWTCSNVRRQSRAQATVPGCCHMTVSNTVEFFHRDRDPGP